MVHALLVLAAEEAETSKTLFYVCAGLLAGWAVLLSLFGLRSPDFPGSDGAARGVMTVSVVLVAATVAASIITA
jgi:hypothetical protein